MKEMKAGSTGPLVQLTPLSPMEIKKTPLLWNSLPESIESMNTLITLQKQQKHSLILQTVDFMRFSDQYPI